MAKQYALKGHEPGAFTAGNLGNFDTRKMDEETAQRLIKLGVPLVEINLVPVVKKNAKPDVELSATPAISPAESEESTK